MTWRVAERFGHDPEWFESLSTERQVELMAYERVREAEESERL